MPDTITDELAADRKALPRRLGVAVVIKKIVWVLALGLIGLLLVSGETDISSAASAPQQAAAAAMACFRLVAVYAFARGVDALCS